MNVLSSTETAYVVACLRIALSLMADRWTERDRDIVTLLMLRLAGSLNLSKEVISRLDPEGGAP